MNKILLKGHEYVFKETARLRGIVEKGRASQDKLDNMKTRINVLTQF